MASKLKRYEVAALDSAGRRIHERDMSFRSIADARAYNIGYYERNSKVGMVSIRQLLDNGHVNMKGYSGTIVFNRKAGVFTWMPVGSHYTGKIYTINPNTGELGRRAYNGIDY